MANRMSGRVSSPRRFRGHADKLAGVACKAAPSQADRDNSPGLGGRFVLVRTGGCFLLCSSRPHADHWGSFRKKLHHEQEDDNSSSRHLGCFGGMCKPSRRFKADEILYGGADASGPPVGGVLLTAQTGYLQTVKHWVGILYSSDGWKTDTVASADYLRKELIYSGTSGSTIELGYREYRGGFAAPAFYQSVKYDLAQSKVVTFQNFQIEVQFASNSEFKGKLLRD